MTKYQAEPNLNIAYSSTDNFLSPIPVFDWLIFCWEIRYFIKKGNENDKITIF